MGKYDGAGRAGAYELGSDDLNEALKLLCEIHQKRPSSAETVEAGLSLFLRPFSERPRHPTCPRR